MKKRLVGSSASCIFRNPLWSSDLSEVLFIKLKQFTVFENNFRKNKISVDDVKLFQHTFEFRL